MNTEGTKAQAVTFTYRPRAGDMRVSLVGEFNGWNPGVYPMQKVNGHFEVTVELQPGVYAYSEDRHT